MACVIISINMCNGVPIEVKEEVSVFSFLLVCSRYLMQDVYIGSKHHGSKTSMNEHTATYDFKAYVLKQEYMGVHMP